MDGLLGAATPATQYLPLVSTAVAAAFTVILWRHWRRSPSARHLMWWTIGVALFGLATLAEAINTVFGWHEAVFRTWYIAGALLGGAPLAQGTVYLLLTRKAANRLSVALLLYVTVAAAFVVATPLTSGASEIGRLHGDAMEWQWVRLFSPLVNVYALVFLVGGAIWSAWRHRRSGRGSSRRVWGYWLIAVGALLPGIGGAFARAGHLEVLYLGELSGLILIWAGYTLLVGDGQRSVAQRAAPGTDPSEERSA